MPTCTEEGERTRTCRYCALVKTEVMEKVEHQTIDYVQRAPTCSTPGRSGGKYCVVCETTVVQPTIVKPLGHTIETLDKGTVKTMPTCTSSGTRSYDCPNCDYTVQQPFVSFTSTEVFEKAKRSVGEIVTYGKDGSALSLGTCFVYAADGKFITNYHVIENAYSAEITMNGSTYDVRYVLAYDKNIDIAVLQVDATNLTPLRICKKSHAVGEKVYAIGSPQGLTDTFSQGMITGASREIENVFYVQHDAAISGGNSGGPLINQYLEVIGINTMTVADSQNLNFAIAMTELDHLTFGPKLTMRDVYDIENPPSQTDPSWSFVTLKNYIRAEGDYDEEDSSCYLLLSRYKDSLGVWVSHIAYYDIDMGVIGLMITLGDEYVTMMLISDSAGGQYAWSILDMMQGYMMVGIIDASTFTESTVLAYIQSDFPASSNEDMRKTASAMCADICPYISLYFYDIGVTAESLGFSNFS